MAITPISPSSLQGLTSVGNNTTQPAGNTVANTEKSFSTFLNSLNESEAKANDLMSQLASGENDDLHDVMIGVEENDIQFRVAMGIRDRLVDAYREMMRMQI
jgi:flagellar hook-basal body complex protein FliE